ncbi:MAG: hypothetical protein CML16_04455 [Pusillimonas sp.]|nr:hypothetical protein [Pusillimonas sp.]MBC43968.1 hypothetical protein [Pusillimonas sp.]HCP78652.1 hypothetical protein [Pusillimonas sp.]|tara:strand:- start:8271 stop:8945 length:675 start_codon:yes stop_codon:yes gene_type:complete
MKVLTSLEHQKLLQKHGAPVHSNCLTVWCAWFFCWSVEAADVHLHTVEKRLRGIDPHEPWVLDTIVREYVVETLQILGLPSDFSRHEQPYIWLHLFPHPRASSSLYEFATDPDDDERPMEPLIPVLLSLWCIKLRELAVEYRAIIGESDDVWILLLGDVRRIGQRLLLLTWPKGHVIRAQQELLNDYIEYFYFCRGSFDLESGSLSDREIPALCEFAQRYRRAK